MINYDELKERVGWGEEFAFYYRDDEYWISHNSDGYYLTKSYCDTQAFKSSEELFDKGRIDDKLLFELWDDIKQCFK